MLKWQDYEKQYKMDMQSAKILYTAAHYGNAAYFLQQSVEKYIKTILYRRGLFQAPLKTHNPLSKFAKELMPLFQKLETIVKKYGLLAEGSDYNALQNNYLIQCEKLIDACIRKETVKIAIWKNSLGIVLDSNEESLLADFPLFRSYRRFNLAKIVAYSPHERRSIQFMSEIGRDTEINKLRYYRQIAELGRMIIATFPHEDLGRYPVEINTTNGNESSILLYERQRNNLRTLIETTSMYMA